MINSLIYAQQAFLAILFNLPYAVQSFIWLVMILLVFPSVIHLVLKG